MTKNSLYMFEISYTFSETNEQKVLDTVEPFIDFLQLECDRYMFHIIKNEKYQIEGTVRRKKKTRLSSWRSTIKCSEFKELEIKRVDDFTKRFLFTYKLSCANRIAGPFADRRLYIGSDLPKSLLPWQKKLDIYLSGKIDPREIIWVKCNGCSGKSTLCKWLVFYKNALKLSFGNSGDLLNLVSKNLGRRIYLFDLTRSKPKDASMNCIYNCIENIKDGLFVNTKYNTRLCIMEPPHIVCFSNFFPDFAGLTKDRWNIIVLPDNCNPHKNKIVRRFKL